MVNIQKKNLKAHSITHILCYSINDYTDEQREESLESRDYQKM